MNIILLSTSKDKGHKGPGNGGIGDVDVLEFSRRFINWHVATMNKSF